MDALLLALPYQDNQGDSHPSAVWFPVLHTEDRLARVGSIVWYGYRDIAAFLSGLQPIGQHTVAVNTPTFLAGAASPPQGTTQGANAAALDIYLALHVLDTDSGTKDANGAAVMRSFFEGATTVAVTIPDGP